MNEHFNGLNPAEHERLSILAEELAEAIQIIGKILRHGLESINPNDVNSETNRSLLEKELGDVHFAVHQMVTARDIKATSILTWAIRKEQKIQKYLHHQ